MKIKRGDYIRKKNFTPLLGKHVPVIKVKNISNKGQINSIMNSENNHEDYVIISEKEAIELMEEWNRLSISSKPVELKEFVHFREDTGEPKYAINAFHIKEVLFKYLKTHSEAFEAYKCPVCNQYHLGKNKEYEAKSS